MGVRGPIPKPTGLKALDGKPGRRPLPKELNLSPGIPARPKRMSAPARAIWDELVTEMAPAKILRTVDQRALWQLAEDEALIEEAYAGIWKTAKALKDEAKAKAQTLPGGALFTLLQMKAGRMALNSISDLANRVIVQRREFGLTPSARARFDADSVGLGAAKPGDDDPLELKLCG
jgi:phage terminase small subunit